MAPLPCLAFLSQSHPLCCLWAEKLKEPFLCLAFQWLALSAGFGSVETPSGAGLGVGGAGGHGILSLPGVWTSRLGKVTAHEVIGYLVSFHHRS